MLNKPLNNTLFRQKRINIIKTKITLYSVIHSFERKITPIDKYIPSYIICKGKHIHQLSYLYSKFIQEIILGASLIFIVTEY